MKIWISRMIQMMFRMSPITSPPSSCLVLILRRRQTPAFRTGSKAPLSINPEQTPGFRPGIVEGLIIDRKIIFANGII